MVNHWKQIRLGFVPLLLVLALSACVMQATPTSTASSTPPPTVSPSATPATPAVAIPPEISANLKDWPLPNKDYANTRFTVDSQINASNVQSLGVAWSFTITATGAFGSAATNPLIAGDTVYFQDLQDNVFALNLATGITKWEKLYHSQGVVGPNGPAIGYGKVFISHGYYNMAALDSATGKELWSVTVSPTKTIGIDMQPVVYNGMVYFSTVPGAAVSSFYGGSAYGTLFALDQQTGRVVWRFDTVDDPQGFWGHPEVNSGGGAWYSPAIDLQTGLTYWGIGNPAPLVGTPTYPNGSSHPGPNLYTDSLLAVQAATGKLEWFNQVWHHDIKDYDLQIPPILAQASIVKTNQDIVIGAGKMGRVYAFDRKTGSLLWTTVVGSHNGNDQLDAFPPGTTEVLPGIFGGVETPMAFADGTVYVPVVDLAATVTPTGIVSFGSFAEGKGHLVAINANTGQIKWEKTFNSLNVGGATVVNDLVFTGTFDGTFYAFKRDTGEQVWSAKAPASINGWPAVGKDTIVWPAGVGGSPALVALRLGAGQTSTPSSPSPSPTPSSSSPTPTSTATSVTLDLVAKALAFDRSTLTVPAGVEVTLRFDNQDSGVQHNFSLYTDASASSNLFVGEIITGPKTITYHFKAPAQPGSYFYRCDVHPQMMIGQLIVQ